MRPHVRSSSVRTHNLRVRFTTPITTCCHVISENPVNVAKPFFMVVLRFMITLFGYLFFAKDGNIKSFLNTNNLILPSLLVQQTRGEKTRECQFLNRYLLNPYPHINSAPGPRPVNLRPPLTHILYQMLFY